MDTVQMLQNIYINYISNAFQTYELYSLPEAYSHNPPPEHTVQCHQSKLFQGAASFYPFYLRFLQFLVIVCFKLDKRTKDVLVLISIFISKEDVLWLFINPRLFQVLQSGRWVLLQSQTTGR